MKEKDIAYLELLAILKDSYVGFFLFSNIFYFSAFFCVHFIGIDGCRAWPSFV